ncbi:MAG TPA: ferredoxin [Paludibacter sp.]|jgi:ferredoxin|nr:ferredoxin [Paludibacter sp.]
MAITKVWIEEDCTACGVCEDICPQVFLVQDISTIIEGVNYAEYTAKIKEAADNCPVDVIKFTE